MAVPYARALAYIYAVKNKKHFRTLVQEIWPNVKGIDFEEARWCLKKLGVVPASLFTSNPAPQDIGLFISFYKFTLLDRYWLDIKELISDADLRLTLDAMIIAKYPKEEIYNNVPADKKLIDIYIDNFFNIEYLKKEDLLAYINRLRHEYHYNVLKEALNPSSKDYLDFMLGIKTKRLTEEKVVEEIYRGLFVAFRDHLIKGNADQAAKLAKVAISAAKVSKDLKSNSASATQELLNVLKNVRFDEEEQSGLIIDKEQIEDGNEMN